jgi:hypothetical protein
MDKKKIIIIGILIFITVIFFYQKFSYVIFPKETQVWDSWTNINQITGKIEQRSMSLNDYLKEIEAQLNTWFDDNFAKIYKTEVVDLNEDNKSLLKDNFYLVKFTVSWTDKKEKVWEFFKLMLEKKNKNVWNINIDEAMKKFQDSDNYNSIVEQININLKNIYWDIMTKWFYMIVEDRNWIYIVNRVWDYLSENYRWFIKPEDKNGLLLLKLLSDYLNYWRLYKANDSEVETILWVQNVSLKRSNLYETLIWNAKSNDSYKEVYPFLERIKDKF